LQFDLDITLMAITAALFVRFALLMTTLPMLDMRSVPPLWRFATAFCFAVALAPAVREVVPYGEVDLRWTVMLMEVVRSLVIGAMIGFTINLLFTAVRFAGSVAGMQIGFSIVNAFDPMTNSQVSIIAQLYYILTIMLFFTTGAHQLLVGAMFQSCVVLPPFGTIDMAGGAWYLLKEFGTVFSTGVRIAAPVIVVLLLVSASMGVIVKTVPQLNVLVVGFPVKIGVGLITFGMSLVFFKTVTMSLIGGMEGQLTKVLLAMR
jgi:flagellar biosynthetic protein FliR